MVEKLRAAHLGLAGGIIWGVALFVITLIAIPTQYATSLLQLIAEIYPGYSISLVGSFVGLLYGFLDGFVALFILAWLYNKFNTKN